MSKSRSLLGASGSSRGSLNSQTVFNNIMKTVQEQPLDLQKKMQEVIEKVCNNFASHLEEASQVCGERGRMFAEYIMPIIAHGSNVFKYEAGSVRNKYDSCVQTATKLHAAIRSSQTESRIIIRAIMKITDGNAAAIRDACRKVLEECTRANQLMLKHIKEHMPADAGKKSRSESKQYARPGGVPGQPTPARPRSSRTSASKRSGQRPAERKSSTSRGRRKSSGRRSGTRTSASNIRKK